MRPVGVLLLFLIAFPAAASDWWFKGSGSGGGGIGAANVSNPAANNLGAAGTTLTTLTSCAGAVISNSAVGEEMRVDLCNAAAGMEVWVVWDDASQTLVVEPQAADRIDAPETNAIGDGLTWTGGAGTDGSVLHFYAPAADEWRVLQIKGTQPADNNSAGS